MNDGAPSEDYLTPVFLGGPMFGGIKIEPGSIRAGTICADIDPRKKDLLDHGYVRLVDSMGSDLSVSRAARVSYDSPPRTEDAKLIQYLMDHRHSTPFEAVTLTFEVMLPIFVARQWIRHRTQSFNELSARYKELPETYYVPKLEDIGAQSQDNKQMRVDAPMDDMLLALRADELRQYDDHCIAAFRLYRDLLDTGWPRELARGVLPLCTYTHMFTTMNLWNLFNFLNLRCDTHAQKEIRVYAEAMVELARLVVPVSIAAWETKHGKNTN